MLPSLGIQENFLEERTPKKMGSKVEGAFQAEKSRSQFIEKRPM